MIEIESKKSESTLLLDNGVREQQTADELLADADAARDMARKALEKAENLLIEARRTLEILRGIPFFETNSCEEIFVCDHHSLNH